MRGAQAMLVVLAACYPAPPDYVGKACDSVENVRPRDLYCVDGRCSATKPSPVSVFNDDFESDTTAASGWSGDGAAHAVTTAQVHGGARAMQVTPLEGAPLPVTSVTNRALTVKSGVHCASAWVLHGTANGVLSLTVQALGTTGGVVAQSNPAAQGASTAVPVGGKQWVQLLARLEVDEATASNIALTLNADATTGQTVFIDDVSLVRAFDVCP